jgi:hypothetical protein
MGDAYCINIYSSSHGLAGAFLRGIAPDYPKVSGMLTEASQLFDREAGCLKQLLPLLSWRSPEKDEPRNEQAAALLRDAAGFYGSAVDLLATAVMGKMQS